MTKLESERYTATWHGDEAWEHAGLSFEPGESRSFPARECIPHEILQDHRFSVQLEGRDAPQAPDDCPPSADGGEPEGSA